MKLTWTDKVGKMKLVTVNPNEEITGFYQQAITDAYYQGLRKLLADTEQAIRKCKSGEVIVVKGYPLVIEVSKSAPTKKVKEGA